MRISKVWLASAALFAAIGASALAAPQSGGTDPHAGEERFGDVLMGRGQDHPGASVYADNCAFCHDGTDQRAPHLDMLRLMSPQSIVAALTHGAMKVQGEGLSGDERQAVAAYLTGREPGEAVAEKEPPRCTATTAVFDFNEPPAWDGWGLQQGNRRYLPTDVAGIDKDSVKSLKLKWAFAFPDSLRVRSQPTPAAGAVFIGSHNGKVYALDQETGCVRWAYQASAEVRTGIAMDSWTAGDTSARPRLYFGDLVGNVYAVDAQSGEQIWKVKADEHPNVTITGAPTLFEGRLYVPVSSLEVLAATKPDYGCCTFRGVVVAYDAASGEQLWKTYVIPEKPAPSGRNDVGTQQFAPSGAPVWNSPAIDAERRQLYVGTGENYSSPANETSDSIIAIGLDDGAVRWVYQATEGDAWNSSCHTPDRLNCPVENGPDFDFGAGAILLPDAGDEGLVIAGQKSGDVHALDPDSGQLLWKRKLGRGGLVGGIHFGLAAGDGRIYVPISDAPDSRDYEELPQPGLYALKPDTGELIWDSPMTDRCGDQKFCYPGHSAAITATSELVLAGGVDGWMRIYDAATGQILWEYDTAREVITVSGDPAHGGGMSGGAAPIAYKGMLFVSSGYGFAGFAPGNVLLVFEVD